MSQHILLTYYRHGHPCGGGAGDLIAVGKLVKTIASELKGVSLNIIIALKDVAK